jgi:hypothetical protein
MIATPGERNRLMQKLRAETCVRRKNGICARANGRSPLFYKEGGSLWGLRPQAPGIYRANANPSE